jgi:hypothetical protein
MYVGKDSTACFVTLFATRTPARGGAPGARRLRALLSQVDTDSKLPLLLTSYTTFRIRLFHSNISKHVQKEKRIWMKTDGSMISASVKVFKVRALL